MQRPGPISVDVQVVPEEASFQRQSGAGRKQRILQRLPVAQHVALDQVDVQIAVVVVVEQCDAGRQHFRKVVLTGHPVEVRERQPDILASDIEPAWLGMVLRQPGTNTGLRANARKLGGPIGTTPGDQCQHEYGADCLCRHKW